MSVTDPGGERLIRDLYELPVMLIDRYSVLFLFPLFPLFLEARIEPPPQQSGDHYSPYCRA